MQHKTEENFATRLNEAIIKSCIPKGDLALKAGIHRGTISRWLGAKTEIPEAKNLHNLASALKVTTSWLLTGEGDKTPVNHAEIAALHGSPSANAVWSEAFLELARANPVNTAHGLNILAKATPPGSKAAIQGLAALNQKNHSPSD